MLRNVGYVLLEPPTRLIKTNAAKL